MGRCMALHVAWHGMASHRRIVQSAFPHYHELGGRAAVRVVAAQRRRRVDEREAEQRDGEVHLSVTRDMTRRDGVSDETRRGATESAAPARPEERARLAVVQLLRSAAHEGMTRQ